MIRAWCVLFPMSVTEYDDSAQGRRSCHAVEEGIPPQAWVRCKSRGGTSVSTISRVTSKVVKLASLTLDQEKMSETVSKQARNRAAEQIAIDPLFRHRKGKTVLHLDKETQMDLQQAGGMTGRGFAEFN